ncbi:MAG: type 4a pilus biogenesis protein PilO [Campylobacteraceae bacterium]|jgi:hypothetical protein|nr:type 4a pilus biogenesis protein PilO [Campylobacteraceae bacterium]
MHDDTLIDKLDNYLSAKKVSEVYLIYLVTIGLIAAIVYFVIFPEAEVFYNKNTAVLNDITKRLNEEQSYISLNEREVESLTSGIANDRALIQEARVENEYMDTKLHELSYLLFNDKSWASFMDRITALAKDYKINILKIENDFKDNKDLQNGKIEQVLNIDIDARGSFHGIIKFINALEESQLVVDVYESTIASNTTNILETNVKLAVWGMLY